MSSFDMRTQGYRPMVNGAVRLSHVNHWGMPRVIPIENEVEYDRHIMTAANNRNLVVAMFYADWCKPCHEIAPVFEQLAQTHVDVVCMKVDVDLMHRLMDNMIGHSFLKSENIKDVPTFVFYRGGKRLGQVTGTNMDYIDSKMKELSYDEMFTEFAPV